jgi:hypothetical protein
LLLVKIKEKFPPVTPEVQLHWGEGGIFGRMAFWGGRHEKRKRKGGWVMKEN